MYIFFEYLLTKCPSGSIFFIYFSTQKMRLIAMPALASNPSVVSDAIHRFAREVRRSPELAGRLGYARAWYAEQREDGHWRFGPSKFVGYEELDAETYLELSRRGLDGRRTEGSARTMV